MTDVDFEKGRIHVQRTVSGRTIKPPKNNRTRDVVISPALAKALRAQIESMSLEASVKNWTTEQRQLVFPTAVAGPPHVALLAISESQARELEKDNAGIYFDWGPDQQAYHAHIEILKPKPIPPWLLEAAS